MSLVVQSSRAVLAVLLAVSVAGCEEPPKASESAGASAKPTASVPAAPSAPAPAASVAPLEPREDCPEGSSGPGTYDKPCEAKGAARLMEATWTGKMGDAGPTFRVVNKSDKVILYGAIAVYFYDKDGKQLDVPGAQPKPKQLCTGKIFAGVMKPDEKAVLTFSCVNKSHVPEGTVAIEAEMETVGFADESGEKTEFYWKNPDLAPDARPKGGIKADKEKAGGAKR
jgi:hypothetical protein